MQNIENEEQFLNRVIFSGEVSFHVSGHVHGHNVKIWADECPHVFIENEHDNC